MQKPIYSPEDEQAIMSLLWSPQIADDPLQFVMTVYPWGKEGTPLATFKGPRKWQIRQLRRLRDHIAENRAKTGIGLTYEMLKRAIVSGRGIGKSALIAWVLDWFQTTKIGSSSLVSANSEAQLRTVTWGELSKWTAMSIHSHWWEMSATKREAAQWLTRLVERDLKIGTRQWTIEGKLWSEENPDGYAGPHNMLGMLVVFDEGAGIPDAIWSVANGYFTEPVEYRYWLAFSNGRRNEGYFYECIEGMRRDFWESEQIDARTVEGVDPKVYQDIIDIYGEDSDEARTEVYGQFPRMGDDAFISGNLVDEAFKRGAARDPTAPIVIGVDPARGGDKTVILVRQGRDVIAIREHDEDDTMLVVGLVIDAIEEFKPVFTVIDEGGVGAGVYDRLKEQRYRVRGVNFGSKAKRPIAHGNLRAQMWDDMRLWLRTGTFEQVRNPRALKRMKIDLCGPKKKPDSSGTLWLEGKKEMKARGCASPDYADALCMTFAFPVAVRAERDTKVRRPYSPGAMSTSWMGN